MEKSSNIFTFEKLEPEKCWPFWLIPRIFTNWLINCLSSMVNYQHSLIGHHFMCKLIMSVWKPQLKSPWGLSVCSMCCERMQRLVSESFLTDLKGWGYISQRSWQNLTMWIKTLIAWKSQNILLKSDGLVRCRGFPDHLLGLVAILRHNTFQLCTHTYFPLAILS